MAKNETFSEIIGIDLGIQETQVTLLQQLVTALKETHSTIQVLGSSTGLDTLKAQLSSLESSTKYVMDLGGAFDYVAMNTGMAVSRSRLFAEQQGATASSVRALTKALLEQEEVLRRVSGGSQNPAGMPATGRGRPSLGASTASDISETERIAQRLGYGPLGGGTPEGEWLSPAEMAAIRADEEAKRAARSARAKAAYDARTAPMRNALGRTEYGYQSGWADEEAAAQAMKDKHYVQQGNGAWQLEDAYWVDQPDYDGIPGPRTMTDELGWMNSRRQAFAKSGGRWVEPLNMGFGVTPDMLEPALSARQVSFDPDSPEMLARERYLLTARAANLSRGRAFGVTESMTDDIMSGGIGMERFDPELIGELSRSNFNMTSEGRMGPPSPLGRRLAQARLGVGNTQYNEFLSQSPKVVEQLEQQAIKSTTLTQAQKMLGRGEIDLAEYQQILNTKLESGHGVWDRIGMSMLRSMLVMGAMWGSIQLISQAFSALVENIMAVDKATNTAAYTMGRSATEMQGSVLNAVGQGAQYGLSATQSTSAYVESTRISKNPQVQQQLFDASAQLMVLTGARDQVQVMQELVSVQRQWNLEQIDTQRIVDMTAIALRETNIPMDKFLSSLKEGSSAGRALGMDLEETAGMIAGLMQATGNFDPSKAQTEMERLATLGERTEDLKSLNQIGVMTRNAKNELLPIMDVLDQVRAKWNDWSDAQRSQAAASLFGPRMSAEFTAFMNNYQQVMDMQEKFKNNAGEGSKAIDAMFSSIQAQANRVFPAIGNLITSMLVPNAEMEKKWSDFFKNIADGANNITAVNRTPFGSLRDDMQFQMGVSAYGWNREAGRAMIGNAVKFSGIDESDQKKILDSPYFWDAVEQLSRTSDAKTQSSIYLQLAQAWQARQQYESTPYGPPSPFVDTGYYGNTHDAPKKSGGGYPERPNYSIGGLEITGMTSTELANNMQVAQQLANEYLASLQAAGIPTDELEKRWENTARVIRLSTGEIVTMHGAVAAMLPDAEKINQSLYKKPSIQSVPDLTPERGQQLQGWLKQYETLFKNMGIKQDPQTYLLFGQNGYLAKYVTSSEAMTLALDLLRESVNKGRESSEQLRGHFNIPTAFGYQPPTVWEFYKNTGAMEAGPVNYPWLFPDDTKGEKSMMSTVPTGLSDVFPTTLGDGIDGNTTATNLNTAAIDKWTMAMLAKTHSDDSIIRDNPELSAYTRWTGGTVRPSPRDNPELSSYYRMVDPPLPVPAKQAAVGIPYADLINQAAAKYDIPAVALAAIIKAESGFNPNDINKRSGAVGLGQVMPSDAKGYSDAFAGRPTTKQLLDPATNIDWSARIFSGGWKATGTFEGAAARYFGIGTDADGTTTATAVSRYTKALGSLGGMSNQPLPVQGMPQLTTSSQQTMANTSRLSSELPAGFARLASGIIGTNLLLTRMVTTLTTIAFNTGKPTTVKLITQNSGASAGSAQTRTGSAPGMNGVNTSGIIAT